MTTAMIYIPVGTFLYGDDKQELYLDSFWIDKTPVTNAEYKQFLDANPKYWVPINWDEKTRLYPAGKENHPVVFVSWDDAKAYANWVGKRLPTEQEWEKAARGTDGREYPWGAWQTDRANTKGAGIGGTSPVGQFSPQGDSPYGCVDMVGNVWEWTDSRCRKSQYRGGAWQFQSQGRFFGGSNCQKGKYRVLRGGSYHGNKSVARCAARGGDFPAYWDSDWGFRCCSTTYLLPGTGMTTT